MSRGLVDDGPEFLEQVARHIRRTLYNHGIKIDKGGPGFIMWDDADKLDEMATRLRGPEGQQAHELGRKSLPW